MTNPKVEKIKQDYFTFDGRIGKKQFLISFLILLVTHIVVMILVGVLSSIIGGLAGLLGFVVYIGIMVAYFSIAIRRLHDLNQSGWLSLLLLIPLVNLIMLVYLCIADSKTI